MYRDKIALNYKVVYNYFITDTKSVVGTTGVRRHGVGWGGGHTLAAGIN